MSSNKVNVMVRRRVTTLDRHNVTMDADCFKQLMAKHEGDEFELSEVVLSDNSASLDEEEVQGSELLMIEATDVITQERVYRHIESGGGDVAMWRVRDMASELVIQMDRGERVVLSLLGNARKRGMEVIPMNSQAEAICSASNGWGRGRGQPEPDERSVESSPSIG